ncbi:MAG: pyruvate dehydrogenase (acetyl-transferring) E1 component subunit alpha [Chloroflexota bacterium]|nr:pyruvate dehydrogenase (acetyl-transferring) E1 component subunit alpha [Chloroflexota bacterium]
MAQEHRSRTSTSSDAAADPIELLKTMMKIRRFEEKAAEMYAKGRIKGFLHLYIGQEAVATGAISALRPDDYIVTHYREHGHALARGLDPKRVMAELFGRETGVSGGRGGSMHLFDVEKSFLGGYAIVAGHMPLACGLGMAEQYKGTDRIAVTFFGDGAVNEGEFHESLNLAAVWKLPVLFVVENNLYGMGTDIRRVSAEIEIYKRAAAYNIHSEQVDGMNVLAMYDAVSRLAARARAGDGPVFLEAMCYRFRGHSMADAEFYRSKDEVEHWRHLDPIDQLKRKLLADKTISESDIENLQSEADDMARDAAQFAEESPAPPIESLYRAVYKEPGDA